MNLKPNLWTLLFVLTAGAWFYTSQDAPRNDLSFIPINVLKKDSISQKNFIQGRMLFDSMFNKFIHADSFPDLEYAEVKYFKLEEDEIASLYAHDQGKHIYAVPFIDSIYYKIEGEKDYRCFPAINIAFSTINPGKNPADMMPPGGNFYNFSAPCPPLCDTTELQLCVTEIE